MKAFFGKLKKFVVEHKVWTSVIAGVMVLALLAGIFLPTLLSDLGEKCTVSFESSGGGTFDSITVKKGESLPLDQLPAPMKIGQRFLGWFTDPEANVIYASEPIEEDITLYAGYVAPEDPVVDELTQVLIGDVEQDFAITVTSKTPLTDENLDDHVALVVDYGHHEDGTEIKLSVEDVGGSIYRLTANYAKPGSYQLGLLSADVTFNTDDEVVQKRGITAAARLLVYTVPGESFSNVVYKEAVKDLDISRILAYNEKAVCISGNGAYQSGDIISLPAGDNSNYYTIQKTISIQEAKNAGLEIPSDSENATCYAIKLSEMSEIFDDMEGYLRSELSAEDFLYSEEELEHQIAQMLEGNTQINQLSNLMIAGAEATQEYKTLSVQKLGTVAQVVPLAQQTPAAFSVDVKFNQNNPEYFTDMYGFSPDSKFHMVSITVNKDIEVTNASGKGLTVSAEITFTFGIHIHIDADVNYYGVYADYDASLTTLTHTSVKFNLSVKTTDGTGSVNLNGAFEDLLKQVEEDVRNTPDAFFDMYDKIMGNGSSDRLTLVSARIAEPSYYVGIIKISFPVDLELSVDLHAAFNAEVEIKTGNKVGVEGDTVYGYRPISYHASPSIRFYMMIQGHADIRTGIELNAQLSFIGLDWLGSISLSAEVGPYVDLYGYYYLDLYSNSRSYRMLSSGAYYMGVGIYLDVDANATVLSKTFTVNLYDRTWEFLRFGSKETLHSLSTTISEPLHFENDGLDLNDPEVRNAIKLKFYDITKAASDSNPYSKAINFDDFRISTSSYSFSYDPENQKVYFTGTANTDAKEGWLYLHYLNTSESMFSTLSLRIPIRYWNNELLGDYDPAKADEVYTITYTLEGRVLKTQQVPYGTRLTGSGDWDSKSVAGNDDIIYGRVKWDHGNPIVMSDMTFEGVGELANCWYYLYILNEDQHYTYARVSAPYGELPDFSAYTDTNGEYLFTHWYTNFADRPVEITVNLSKSTPARYIANYVKRSQATLTFDPGDGVLLDNHHVQQENNTFDVHFDDHNGSDIFLLYHAVPKDLNLKFVGFELNGKIYKEGDRINVKPDQEYHLTAVYENKSTAITFVDSGETFIAYREPGETMSIPQHKDTTQTFLGWKSTADGSFYTDMSDYYVSGQDTLTAVYDASTKVHTVTYDLAGGKLSDGRTEVTVEVLNGKYAPDIGIPTLEKDGKTYIFTGWSPELGPVTRDTTYTALYSEVKTYTVTYDLAGGKLSDGRTSVTIQVAEGEYAPEIGTPTLDKNDGKTYTFVEWSPEMAPITKDTTYTAVYKEVTVLPPSPTGVHHKIENGVLTIYGNGSIEDYYGNSTENRPWNNDSSITKIVVEDGILSIGAYAFWNMPSVTEVQIAESVESIGIGAFSECAELQKINLPSKLTQLGESALYGTAITSLTFPAGITEVPEDVAAMCTNLTRVTFASGTKKIGNRAFQQCTALTSVTLPSTLEELGDMAFEETAITSITIPSGVTKIGSSTFYGCTKLSAVSLHDNITSIDDTAFRGCTALRSIALPGKLKTIGAGAFSESGLVSVTIPEGVTTLPMDAFSVCENLVSVTIPKSVTTIEMGAFYSCPNLKEVSVPTGCQVGSMAFDEGVTITYYE